MSLPLFASLCLSLILTAMYASTFIFAAGQFNDAYHQLDQEIAEMARQLPGYLGEESWSNATSGLVSTVYYWSSLEALQQLMQHPKHLAAKAAQGQWLAGYQVVISQVLRTYGDGKIDHLLPPRGSAAGHGKADGATA
jgi:heme-degrading monooxygenase HmoA